jgi:hypothetical protein
VAGVAEHQPGRVGGQQVDAVADEPVEQIDDVVLVDQGVERDERPTRSLFAIRLAHDRFLPSAGGRIGLRHVLGEHQPPIDHVTGDVDQ